MRSLHLEMSESSTGSAIFVKLIGEFDLADERLFAEAVTHGVAQDGRAAVVLECSELTFIDSSGLHAFLAAKGQAEAAGASFVLVAPSPAVRKILEVAGLIDHFTVARELHGLDH
ncbi:MAG TPA: STAS domain-containing protein [Actinomycetota bacterium]|nr:STAS domain-containing protein [Actinomycetota bacterium]